MKEGEAKKGSINPQKTVGLCQCLNLQSEMQLSNHTIWRRKKVLGENVYTSHVWGFAAYDACMPAR